MKKLLIGLALISISTLSMAQNYKTQLNGKRLYIEGSKCAGVSLQKKSGIYFGTNDCKFFPARVIWATEDTFFLTQTVSTDQVNPPKNFIYKVVSTKGNKVVLQELFAAYKSSNSHISLVIRE